MKKTTIAILAAATIAAATMAKKQVGYKSIDLLPDNTLNIGYHYDFTESTIYGDVTPISFTEKYISGWINDLSLTLSKTHKWITDDANNDWNVFTLELMKGIDGEESYITLDVCL